MNSFLRFTRNYRNIVNGNKVVIVNRDTGMWMRISKECFDLLDEAILKECKKEELLQSFQDTEDREYFEELLDNAEKLGVISECREAPKRIETVYLILTNRCNLKCKHCCVSAEAIGNEIVNSELNTISFKKAIDKIVACNPDRIIVSGGEPMIRKDFMEIIQYLRSLYRGMIDLSTNAILINSENVKEIIRNVDRIDISIDGVDEETCSMVRGKGVFEKVISAIKLLKAEGFNEIFLSMVFGDYNEGLQEKFKKLNKELGTQSVIRAFVPIGRGKENKEIFVNPEKDSVPENEYTDEEMQTARQGMVGIRCGAGVTDLTINYDGNVYPCANLLNNYYKMFNIFEVDSIPTFINADIEKCEGYKKLESIQPENYEKCKDCKVNLFCWSCLQDIENLKEHKESFERYCYLKKNILYPIVWGEEVQ